MNKFLFLAILFLTLPLNLNAADFTYDLGISSSDISFSKELVSGQTIRIYAGIHNYGQEDVAGYVTFYQGNILIGDSQVVSVRAGGLVDEVYVDWKVPSGSFNIRAEIKGQNPKDENPINDLAITSFFVPLPDSDGDGIPDERDTDDDNDGLRDDKERIIGTDPLDSDTDNDNCLDSEDDFPLDPAACIDTDKDGIDDQKDNDDDNDGLSDTREEQINTNPKNPDSDGDSIIDSQDYCPGDSKCSQEKLYVNTNINTNENLNTNEANINENLNLPVKERVETININEAQFTPSSNLIIVITKQNWNTYVFRPQLRGLVDENLIYEWDFGDGTKLNQKIALHQFAKSGKYKVSLKVKGENDLELSTNKILNVSFFNLENINLWLVIGGLILLLLILILSLFSKRSKE